MIARPESLPGETGMGTSDAVAVKTKTLASSGITEHINMFLSFF
jgi:hypothetical protein